MQFKTLHMTLLGIATVALVAGELLYMDAAEARGARAYARTNVNRGLDRGIDVNRDRNVNRDVNVNRNVNVDVDVDRHGWGCCDHHPVATGVAIGATAAVTAAVIGSVVYSLPPSCTSVIVSGISYQQCGSIWYQPQYAGSNVTYVVVNPPR